MKYIIKSERKMINFEEVDRIEMFCGVNMRLVLGRELIES